MAVDLSKLSQGELIAFAKGMIEADAHFSGEAWAFRYRVRWKMSSTPVPGATKLK